MKFRYTLLVFLLSLGLLLSPIKLPFAQEQTVNTYSEYWEGRIEEVSSAGEETLYKILVTKGDKKGESIEIMQRPEDYLGANYEEGQRVLIEHSELPELGETFFITSQLRRPVLEGMFLLFVGLVLLVSRKQGFASLTGMVFTFLVLFKGVLPLILLQFSPVLAALLGAALIIPVNFYLAHGYNSKTNAAVLGTLITLALTGLLASIFAKLSFITGYAADEVTFLQAYLPESFNYAGLALAGILVGVLGILDDVTIAQASVVKELKEASPNMGFAELFSRAMTVGKDHIASVVNTLVLVYVGASLPLFLLFLDQSQTIGNALNFEYVAQEVVEMLAGSMGLVLAVPITTLIACTWRFQVVRSKRS